MTNRLLIAAGTAKYRLLDETMQRPQLTASVETLARAFTDKLGYTRVLSDISLNPTSRELVTHLDTWFGSSERNSTDWIVLYYTAHAELDGPQFYLYATDTEDGMPASTAVSASQLASVLVGRAPKGEKRRVRNCLLILDTCFAAGGAFSIIGRLRSYFEEDDPGRFYVIAAALPRETARAGALATALIAAIDEESLAGPQQQWLSFEELDAYVNRYLQPHKAFFANLGGSIERAQFFPNPRYIQGLPPSTTIAELRRIAYEAELRSFWLGASRGIESDSQEAWYSPDGWYFTGRKHILSELDQWLAGSADSVPRVITGPPGSGKSALIGYLVLLADPEFRFLSSSIQHENAPAPEKRHIDIAVYAKGKTYDEIVMRFADHLGADPNETAVLRRWRDAPRCCV